MQKNWENNLLYVGNNLIAADDDAGAKDYKIKDGTTLIASCVFCFDDNIESITIPVSVVNIGNRAFSYCSSLTDVYYSGTEEQWNDINVVIEGDSGDEEDTANNEMLEYATIHYQANSSVLTAIVATKEIKTSEIADNCVLTLKGQTAADLKKAVSADVNILDKNSKAVKNTAKLATGMQIVLTDGKGNVLDTATVVVPGDVDGDGDIKAADARSALRAAVKLDTLSECEMIAADLDAASTAHTVNSSDARYILRASVGLEAIDKWFNEVK